MKKLKHLVATVAGVLILSGWWTGIILAGGFWNTVGATVFFPYGVAVATRVVLKHFNVL
jgi:hypothetical protein